MAKVYRAWRNGTVENKRRGNSGGPELQMKKGNGGCDNALEHHQRATVEEPGVYLKYVQNYSSANIAACRALQQTDGNITYSNACASVEEARICKAMLGFYRLAKMLSLCFLFHQIDGR